MASVANQIEQTLAAKEHLAEELLINKQAILDFERRKSSNAAAISHVKRSQDKKLWTFSSDMFIKLPTNKTQELLEKDQKVLDEKIEASKQIVDKNTLALKDMENKRDLHGFNLSGLTATDLYNNTK
ncbi:uncharacterized protein EV154DRAFT_496798 [Mucor mucedo]|uniref:uncharacterized protein n=1 Tax=Mucor mucedo TaxID=29922 RepID=UPI00221EF18D|nr:uncharacterized protein EV154DRAFT_496798 [Mucor mucedo]KAI7895048.1 hypothetical protein EV154DRAFT_496798 [Mucor mucedo]